MKTTFSALVRKPNYPSSRMRAADSEGLADEEEPATEDVVAAEEVFAPLAESLGAFLSAPGGLPDLANDFTAPEVDALPVKRLGPPPFWRSKRNFAVVMEEDYRAIGAEALHHALGEETGPAK